jgi:translation initiation factor 6
MTKHEWHARKASFRSDPNIGLYLYATDNYCLAGIEVPEEQFATISEVLGVPVHRFSIAGTGLVGVFLAGTNEQLLVPNIITDREERILEKLHISYHVIESDFTALGNNILCNQNGLLISEDYSEQERKAIEHSLGLKAKVCRIGEITVIGSCGVATERGCVLHRGAKDFEQELIAQALGVPVELGSVNLGNGFVRAGLVANTHGMLVGDQSGGPEIVHAEQVLRGEQ